MSYLFHNATQDHLEELKTRLNVEGLSTNLIYSSKRDLDVLPHSVDKGEAAKFLAERLGYSPERVITAGNSGNDAALMQHGFRGIVVANAHSELKNKAGELGAFISPQPRADGVIDGIKHWMQAEDS